MPTVQNSINHLIAWNSITGFLLSSIAGTNTTASFTIGTGQAADSGNIEYISKSTTTSWAASNGNAINGTDAAASTLANSTTYHVFMITGTSGTGSFVSSSLTPTFPSGYTRSNRRVGSFRTNSSGAPLPYTSIEIQGGAIRNYLTTQVADVAGSATTTASRTLYTLTSIPTGIKFRPIVRWISAGAVTAQFLLTSPDETDVAPAGTSLGNPAAPGYDINNNAVDAAMYSLDLTTNTSAQVGGRSGSTSLTVTGITRGWDDFRRS